MRTKCDVLNFGGRSGLAWFDSRPESAVSALETLREILTEVAAEMWRSGMQFGIPEKQKQPYNTIVFVHYHQCLAARYYLAGSVEVSRPSSLKLAIAEVVAAIQPPLSRCVNSDWAWAVRDRAAKALSRLSDSIDGLSAAPAPALAE